MDPVSIVTSVLSAILTIKKWVDDTKKKDQAVSNLSKTINLVYLTLSPLEDLKTSQRLQPAVIASLFSIGEVLTRIRDHLSLWGDRGIKANKLRGFVVPSSVVDELRDDAQLLSEHLLSISVALHVSTFLEVQSKIRLPLPEPSHLDLVKNVQVRGFWRDMIGEQIFYTSRSEFCRAIKAWLKEDLSPSLLNALVLSLDEFGVGDVTLLSVDQFVGEKTLSDAVSQLQERAQTRSFCAPAKSMARPWLIWINDNPGDNSDHVSFAQRNGISVFQLLSTASAKRWIDTNEDELRQKEGCNQLRFITDNVRWESRAVDGAMEGFFNFEAGEHILRFLRGRQYKAPVLVCCDRSISRTAYVRSYERSGSTNSKDVCSSYISALAKGEADDRGWQRFRAA